MARARPARHPLDDANPRALELLDLVWIIRKKPHATNAERLQRFRCEFIIARIVRKTEPLVGLHGIEAAVLQLVSLQLVQQANSAALLRQIEDHARRLLRNLAKRKFKLRPAVASLGREDVSRKTLRMDAHKRRFPAGQRFFPLLTSP